MVRVLLHDILRAVNGVILSLHQDSYFLYVISFQCVVETKDISVTPDIDVIGRNRAT